MEHRQHSRARVCMPVHIHRGKRRYGPFLTRDLTVDGLFVRSGQVPLEPGELVRLSLRFGCGRRVRWKPSALVVRREVDGVGLRYAVYERGFADDVRSALARRARETEQGRSDRAPSPIERGRPRDSSVENGCVTLVPVGTLDFSAAPLFGQLLEASYQAHRAYLVDLTAVTEIRDSGLSLLLMLARYARRQGILLGFVDSHDPHRHAHQLHRVLRAAAKRHSERASQEETSPSFAVVDQRASRGRNCRSQETSAPAAIGDAMRKILGA